MSQETTVLEGGDLEAFFRGEEKPAEVIAEPEQKIDDFFSIEEKPIDNSIIPAASSKPKEEVIVPQPKSTFSYKDLVAEFIADGDWENVAIELEEGGDPINISDLEDISPELFKDLKAAQNQLKKEELESKYVSTDGLTETDKKILEIKKKGGDITPLLQMQAQHVHPLSGLDLDDERVHESLVRQRLAHKGLHPKIVEAEISRLKEELALDIEAKKVIDEVNTSFDAIVSEDLKKRNDEILAIQEQEKKFKKEMTEQFRKFEFKDSLTKTLVENAAKADENGITNVDKMYFQAKENPELFAQVNLLLTDREAFDKYYGTKIKNKATIENVTKVFKIHPKNAGSTPVQPNKKNELEEFFT